MTPRTLTAEIACPAQCELAEGPVWDAPRGLLRWVDILRGQVHALDSVSGAHSSFGTGQPVGAVGLTRDGGLVLALAGGFALSGPEGQDLRSFGNIPADPSVTRFNDGKPSPWGSLWAGTMAVPEDSGYPCNLYRLSPDGRLDTVVKLPVSQVTSTAFGGADLGTLYITTARENFTPADLAAQPHAGDIFACTPGVTGRPPYLFGG